MMIGSPRAMETGIPSVQQQARLQDIDYAAEQADYTKRQINQTASTAILADPKSPPAGIWLIEDAGAAASPDAVAAKNHGPGLTLNISV